MKRTAYFVGRGKFGWEIRGSRPRLHPPRCGVSGRMSRQGGKKKKKGGGKG